MVILPRKQERTFFFRFLVVESSRKAPGAEVIDVLPPFPQGGT